MRKLLTIISIFVSIAAQAQTFKTLPTAKNTLSYSPFNSAEIDFTKQVVKLGNIELPILKGGEYSASKKRYIITCKEVDFLVLLRGESIESIMQFVDGKQDFVIR